MSHFNLYFAVMSVHCSPAQAVLGRFCFYTFSTRVHLRSAGSLKNIALMVVAGTGWSWRTERCFVRAVWYILSCLYSCYAFASVVLIIYRSAHTSIHSHRKSSTYSMICLFLISAIIYFKSNSWKKATKTNLYATHS